MSSLSNLVATLAIASVATTSQFGSYGVFFTVYLLAITLGRGLVGGVVSIELARVDERLLAQESRDAVGASFLVATVLGVGLLTSLGFWGSTTSPFVATLAISLPALMAQDTLRQLAYAQNRPVASMSNSAAWLGAQVIAFVWLGMSGHAGALSLTIAWAASSVVGLLVGWALLPLSGGFGSPRRWFARHRDLSRSLTLEYFLVGGVAQGAPLLVGAVAGLSAVGAFRGAMTLLGPLTTLAHGMALALVPQASRAWRDGSANFLRPVSVGLGGIASVALVLALSLTAIPDHWGRALLGASWPSASGVIVPMGLWLALGYLAEPAVIALRITGRNWASARVRLITAPATLVAAGVGASFAGAEGAAIALCAAATLGLLLFWGAHTRRAIYVRK